MKKLHLIILFGLILTSCKQISKDVENSFITMSIKLDSLTKIENKKVEKLFNRINSKRIAKYDGENSALVYYSIIDHNRIIDSLIYELKLSGQNAMKKKEILKRFKYVKSNLKTKLNSITEFDTKSKIDSLLKDSNDLKILPNFSVETEIQSEKLNAIKGAQLILSELNEKIKNERKFDKN